MAERNFNPEGPGPWWVLCRDGRVRYMARTCVAGDYYRLTDSHGESAVASMEGYMIIGEESNWDVMQIIGPVEIPDPPKPGPVLFDGAGFYRMSDGRVFFVRNSEYRDDQVFAYSLGELSRNWALSHPFTEKLASWDEVIEWLESR